MEDIKDVKPNDSIANKTEHHKEAVLQALEKSLGIVTTALKSLEKQGIHVGRTAYYEWLKNDPVFKSKVTEIDEIALDFVESQHLANIKKGKERSTLFHLQTKGKRRGYVPKSQLEHTGKDGGKIEMGVEVDISKLSKKAKKELADLIEDPVIVGDQVESEDNSQS